MGEIILQQDRPVTGKPTPLGSFYIEATVVGKSTRTDVRKVVTTVKRGFWRQVEEVTVVESEELAYLLQLAWPWPRATDAPMLYMAVRKQVYDSVDVAAGASTISLHCAVQYEFACPHLAIRRL